MDRISFEKLSTLKDNYITNLPKIIFENGNEILQETDSFANFFDKKIKDMVNFVSIDERVFNIAHFSKLAHAQSILCRF